MQISVKNLGPIKEGTIDLSKSLTILTGPNNTGKSYLTYLIHGATQHWTIGGYGFNDELSEIFKKNNNIAREIESGEEIDIVKTSSKSISDISDLVTSRIQNNLTKIYAHPMPNTVVKFSFDSFGEEFAPEALKSIRVVKGKLYTTMMNGRVDENVLQNEFYDVLGKSVDEKIPKLFSFITSAVLSDFLPRRTFFFPAERPAINMFAKHITSSKADSKDELDSELISTLFSEKVIQRLRKDVKKAPKYPYAIREYINFVNAFGRDDKEGEFSLLADKVEAVLTGGKIKLNEFEQLLFTPHDSSASIEIHVSSSLVKSLSYFILYLRFIAKQNDLVIIDEPELNLHPDIQIELAKIIAEMVNSDLRVIISTHSDYLIKELNNLILLSRLPKSKENSAFLAKYKYQPEHLLDSARVGAYFLSESTIVPIDVEENGIEVPSINNAMTSIDSIAQEIFFRLEE